MLEKILGIIGILLISAGVINKKRSVQDSFYILGGLVLVVYSILVSDLIFTVLECFLTTVAIVDYIRTVKNKNVGK